MLKKPKNQFNLFSDSSCPVIQVELEATNTDLRKHCFRAGNYTLRDGKTTNGKPDWVSNDGSNSIWYISNGNYWAIGSTNHRGSSNIGLVTEIANLSSPVHESKWHFYYYYWRQATNDIRIKCAKGIFKLLKYSLTSYFLP